MKNSPDKSKIIRTVFTAVLAAAVLLICGCGAKSDKTTAKIYITTDNGEGGSYGSALTKADGNVSAHVIICDPLGETIADDTEAKVKIRGNSTSNGKKKPYQIKFSEKTDILGMGECKKWILLADFFDPTLMRNSLAMKMAKDFDLEGTPDYRRAELWFDGEYAGLYLLSEKIEADENRVNIDTKNGDFIIEIDTPDRSEEEDINFYSEEFYFRVRDPDDPEKCDVPAIQEKVIELEHAMQSGDYESVLKLVDIDSFVDYYILNEYLKPIDFDKHSVYFYCKDGKFYAGPIWDYDLSCGNENEMYSLMGPYESAFDPELNFAKGCHFYRYLMKYPEFCEAVSKRYAELKEEEYFSSIYADDGWIIAETKKYRRAIGRNNKLFDIGSQKILVMRNPDDTYEENLTYLLNWLKVRDQAMEEYFKGEF